MAALISSDFEIPAEISQGIFEKAQKGSTLAQLSGARPQKFGKQQVWVLTSPPKAELVGEAGQKSPTPTAYAHKAVNPFKLQVTMIFAGSTVGRRRCTDRRTAGSGVKCVNRTGKSIGSCRNSQNQSAYRNGIKPCKRRAG